MTLWRLLVALAAASVAVLVTSVWAFQALHGTAAEVRTRSAPSILGVSAARAALVAADAAAITSFSSGEVRLAGPGERYQNQIAVASQSLAQVAENNVAGEAASQTIQLVEGLLVAYTGLIEQADAHYRQDSGRALGAADLWYASHLLHTPDGGIFVQLDTLRDAENAALAGQLSSGGTNSWWVFAWVMPLLVLLALLAVTQSFLRQRFRRTLSLPLAAATVILFVLVVGMAFSLGAKHDLESANSDLSHASSQWRDQQDATDRQSQRDLVALVRQNCSRSGGCGDTIDLYSGRPEFAAASGSNVDDKVVSADIRHVDERAAAAVNTAQAQVLVLVSALVVIALVPLGLYGRIEEYRYRAR
jgi:hypothetical protein